MTTLHLDPENRTLTLSAELAGETTPIDFEIHYEVESNETGRALIPRRIQSSREWMTTLAEEFLKTQTPRFPIPAGLPSVVARLFKI